jgi:NitT/TauT family transport system substrate-binding protein
VALGALLLSSPASAQELKEINVMVPNNNTTNLFQVIVARDLGWFEEAGLKVNYLDADTTIPYVAFLSNGQADTVMLDAPQTFQAVRSNLPIRVAYEAMQNAPEGLFVPEGGEVKTLQDLKGKTVGLASDRDQATTRIVLESVGMSIDDVKTVVVGNAGPVIAKAMKDNTVQAFAAAANDLAIVAAFGITMKDLTPPKVKINPANTFSVWEPTMEEKRDILTKFFKVWTMATVAGKVNPEVVAKMAAKQVPDEWENQAAGQALMDASFFLSFPVTEKYGDMEPDLWKSIQPAYIKAGELQAEVDPATFLDGSFIDAANDVDEAKIKADLEKWAAENP